MYKLKRHGPRVIRRRASNREVKRFFLCAECYRLRLNMLRLSSSPQPLPVSPHLLALYHRDPRLTTTRRSYYCPRGRLPVHWAAVGGRLSRAAGITASPRPARHPNAKKASAAAQRYQQLPAHRLFTPADARPARKDDRRSPTGVHSGEVFN